MANSSVPTEALKPVVPACVVPAGLFRAPRPAASRQARYRGQAFRSLLGAIGATCDTAALNDVLELLPQEASSLLRRGEIVGTAWYPVEWFAALYAAAQTVTGGDRELARELGREMTRMDARGIYRFVLRFVSPESLVRHAQVVLGLYIEGPVLTVGALRPGETQLSFRFDNAHGFDDNVWQGMFGASEALIELSGGHAARVRIMENGGDAGWIVAEARWSR